MWRGVRFGFVPGVVAALVAAGCAGGPEGGDVKLAEGGGTVTYKGAPLAGAAVTFIPEKGPLATGQTDLSGKFKLSTGGMAGVAIGKCGVTVTAYEGGASPTSSETSAPATPTSMPSDPEAVRKKMEASSQRMRYGAGAEASGPKSIVPEIYTKPGTTPLSFTVEVDASKNDFKIELKD
jgi:hypothetical protein